MQIESVCIWMNFAPAALLTSLRRRIRFWLSTNPQSVEGPATKQKMKEFNPMLTLRYSATHKADSIYNMVYRLDAMEAYNKRLVKKFPLRA